MVGKFYVKSVTSDRIYCWVLHINGPLWAGLTYHKVPVEWLHESLRGTWKARCQSEEKEDFCLRPNLWTIDFQRCIAFSDGNYFFHRWSMLTSALFNIGQRLWIICVKLFNAKYSVHISRIRSCNEQPIHFPDHWEQRWWLKKNGNKLPESRPLLIFYHLLINSYAVKAFILYIVILQVKNSSGVYQVVNLQPIT